MLIENKLRSMNIVLPTVPLPLSNYETCTKSGNLLFISGQSCVLHGKLLYSGKLGKDLSLEEGYKASRQAVLNCLAIIKSEAGSLDKINKIIKVFAMVNSAEGFTEQPAVINGASDLLVELLGEKGSHARTAVGTNELPFNMPIEIEMIVELIN